MRRPSVRVKGFNGVGMRCVRFGRGVLGGSRSKRGISSEWEANGESSRELPGGVGAPRIGDWVGGVVCPRVGQKSGERRAGLGEM